MIMLLSCIQVLQAQGHLHGQNDTLLLAYDIGHTTLSTQHQILIQSKLDKWKPTTTTSLHIVGSADYLGSTTTNRSISDSRVAHVWDFVKNNFAVEHSNMTKASMGEVNSHLADLLGTRGNALDRSVLLIHQSVAVRISEDESTIVVDSPLTIITAMNEVVTGQTLIVTDLIFHARRHVLLRESIPILKRLLVALRQNETIRIEIQGHVCCRVDDSSHKDGFDMDTGLNNLSTSRAHNIYNYLIINHIDSSRLRFKGYGSTAPLVVPEITDEDKKKNRRVAIKILEKSHRPLD